MSWVDGFLIPLVSVTFILGITLFVSYYVYRGVSNAWSKSWKYVWKFKIRRKPYPEKTVAWVMECMDRGIGWYDAKKLLYIKMVNEELINETMWIYDQIILTLNMQKGGVKHGREIKRSDSKDESQFPNF